MNKAMFEGIDHIDIVVEDPGRMSQFLQNLGFSVIRETPAGRGSIELRFPGGEEQPFIELTPATAPDGSKRKLGLRHMALRAGNLDEAFKVLLDQGFKADAPPRMIGDTGRSLFNLIDPENQTLQIVSAIS
jgi:catechol 2,3-dioxygenase-like lactoylglutathione lyase family enzyme